MKTYSIEAKKRTDLGKKSSKSLRTQEQVPCVMYGGEQVVHFYVHENQFKNLVYTNQVYLVEINLEGSKLKGILKDIQFHPVTDKIIHVDFVEVKDNVPAVVSLPIVLTGTSKGVLAGGKLRQRRRYLKVQGLVKNLPDSLTVDITELNIGNVRKVSELSYPNIELLDPAQAMVVGVISSRLAAKGTSEEISEGAEPAAEAAKE